MIAGISLRFVCDQAASVFETYNVFSNHRAGKGDNISVDLQGGVN